MNEALDRESRLTTATPPIADLIAEFKRCGAGGDAYGRVPEAEDTRLCLWSGQSSDGRKWAQNQPEGREVLPWDGASDMRPFTVDGAVNEGASVLYASFWRAALRVAGIGMDDIQSSSVARTWLDWLLQGSVGAKLGTEVDLAAQYVESYGWCGVMVRWDRQVRRKERQVPLAAMEQFWQQQAGAENGNFGMTLTQCVLDPTLEDLAVAMLQEIADAYVKATLPEEITERDLISLPKPDARAAVRELREKGYATLPVPYLCRNEPQFTTLKPGSDVIIPPESQDGLPVCFVRVLLTEPEVRAKELSDGWDSEWIEQAVKTRGKWSCWEGSRMWDTTSTLDGGWQAVDTRRHYIEVVTAFHQVCESDGTLALHYTVFSPHVQGRDNGSRDETGLAAKRDRVDYAQDKLPVVFLRRERLDRPIVASRGVPEIIRTLQNVEKAQWDSSVDLASLAVIPPRLVPRGLAGQKFSFGPAAENEYQQGREPKFMEIPKGGQPLASELLERLNNRVARLLGLFDESVPPSLNQLLLEPKVKRWLHGWTEILTMAYTLALKFAPESVARVTGVPVQALPDADEAALDFTLSFDVTALQPELFNEKLGAISAIRAEDSAGVLDQAKLTAYRMGAVDPEMARLLVTNQGAASQKMVKDVDQNLVSIAAGNTAIYDDASDDPGAPFKLQTMSKLMANNPRYLAALTNEAIQELSANNALDPLTAQMVAQSPQRQPDPLFSTRLVEYSKNLKQGADQQLNKPTGRLGVKPGPAQV